MQQLTVKTLKCHVDYLENQAESQLGPGKFDIVQEIFQNKEGQRYTMIIIFNVNNQIKINFVTKLCSCHVGNISHENIEVEPEGQADYAFGNHGNLKH